MVRCRADPAHRLVAIATDLLPWKLKPYVRDVALVLYPHQLQRASVQLKANPSRPPTESPAGTPDHPVTGHTHRRTHGHTHTHHTNGLLT